MLSRKLSKNAVKCIEAQHRPSTRQIYHHHWEAWKAWCKNNKVKDPARPCAHHVANYLAFLSQVKGLSAATLKTRRAAIASVLSTSGLKQVTEHRSVSEVIKGAENLQPRKNRFVPEWDLAVVLNYLKSNTMKNNRLLNLDLLTYKTAFLIALASGRRASEITNLSGLNGDLSFDPDGSICLKFLPDFLAKNQRPNDRSPTVRIAPLSRAVDPDQEDISLCPVRALKVYRSRSSKVRSPTQRALFISVNPAYTKDITRATLSRWLKSTIRSAYISLGLIRSKKGSQGSDLTLGNPRSHEIRSWATTMASTTTPIAEVMQAAYWRSPSVFVKHYLRDIAMRSECGKLRLPAMVAAQTAVASNS